MMARVKAMTFKFKFYFQSVPHRTWKMCPTQQQHMAWVSGDIDDDNDIDNDIDNVDNDNDNNKINQLNYTNIIQTLQMHQE